jgi:hypothetical protein
MIDRKKKLKIIQFFLLVFGISIIYFTYYNKEVNTDIKLVSPTDKEILQKKNKVESEDGEFFFNIEYTGLDLNGNRYLLKSEKANLDELKPEIVNMEVVEATFYFKDGTILYVWSDQAVYNNKNLDMKFEKNVRAEYLGSELFSNMADYSNSENYLSIYDNVRINHEKGNLIADKLLFDITNQNLNITSFNNGKINANLKLNEKRF